jgi:prepilin-type N-terminal cleavage/methylation domain-containing protein
MKKCYNAFTLIELTVVLLIIALSMTIASPRINTGSNPHFQLKLSANRIAGIIEYAQQQAACSHFMYFLNIDRQKGTYWITSQNSGDMNVPETSLLKLNGRLPEGIAFANIKLQGINSNLQNTPVIRFSPQGWADPAEILVTCTTGESINIIIDEFSGQIETYSIEK